MWLERILCRWLRAVAPAGWADTVLGDLREEGGAGRFRRLHLALIAGRFTLERLRRRRPRPMSMRQDHGGGPMFVTEIRHAFRALVKSPGFALVAVLTLALAIGANTAIYSALRSLVLQPLPFRDGERFVLVWHRNLEVGGILATPSRQAIDEWRRLTHVFEAVEGVVTETLVVTDGGEPEEIPVSRIQPSLLEMLRVEPVLGRRIVGADTAADAPPVALISHRLWTQRFGADVAVVGNTVTLGEAAYTIVGVMPLRFGLPLGSDSVWVADRRERKADRRESTIAKLQPGVTIEQAQRALDGMGRAARDDADRKGWSGHLMAPGDRHGSQLRVALYVLAGATGLLLLIACVNVANLVLTRNSARRRELAVRHAIGASRGRLMCHLLAESLIVAAAGGVAGLLVAYWGLAAMTALRPHNLAVLDRVHLDGAAFTFAAAVSLAAAILFGLAPAVAAARINLQDVLKTGGWSATASGLRVRKGLAVAQIAIGLVLAVAASLLLRSYANLTAVDPGFDPTGVLSVQVSLPADRYPATDTVRRHAFFEEVLSSVRALPGVSAAAVGSGVPPSMGIMFGTLEIEGQPQSTQTSGLFTGGYITPSYFSTLRIPIVDGRAFTDADSAGREPVAIVGRSLADRHWRGQSPLGSRVRISTATQWATVVGIAADVKGISLTNAAGTPQIYFPRAQTQPGFGVVAVRATDDPVALIPAIKATIWALDPKLPLADIATAAQLLARATSQARFSLALLSAFAFCGLALVTVGVYGVMALFVGQRQRELGLRVALGASRGAVAGLVLHQAIGVLAGGLALGTAGAVMLTGFLQALLFEIPARDSVSFVTAIAAIAVAAACATLVPLRRVATLDPSAVLRGD